jgi:thioredoxin-related protein
MVQYVPFVAINRVDDYDIYGAKPIEIVPGYIPSEELIEVLKRASAKLKRPVSKR